MPQKKQDFERFIRTDAKKIRANAYNPVSDDEEDFFFPAGMQPFEVAEYLDTDIISGLGRKQIKRRYSKHGANIIQNEFRVTLIQSFKNQIYGLISPLLAVSSLVMYAFDRKAAYLFTAGAVLLVMLINAFLEWRAYKALNLPRVYSSIKAVVTREDITDVTDSRKLVPGDIITIEEGMVVPCDARLFDDNRLSVLETPVSGSRSSVLKDSLFLAKSDSELVYPNMVYAGSIVTSGKATAIVCYTGKDTLLRRINGKKAESLPVMLKYIQTAGKYISIASVVVCFALMFIGVVASRNMAEIFIISLSVGAVSLCDTMSALAAASLGYGVKKTADKGSVIKNLNCISTLCTLDTIMCGKNTAFPPKKMTFNGIYTDNEFYPADKKLSDRSKELLFASLACSDIKFHKNKNKRGTSPEFDCRIYDEAVALFLSERGYNVQKELEKYVRIDTEKTLTGEVSRVLVIYNGKNTVILKGAPEAILSRCSGYELNGTGYKMSPTTRKRILSALEQYTQESGFVIAVASGITSADTLRDITAERGLLFKGFITLYSSINVENASAIYNCNQAGIETVVTSPDSYYSAYNTAKNSGIVTSESQVVTADQMYSMDRGLFIANCPNYKLFLHFSDSEWLNVLRLRKEDKRIVGATAERLQELTLMSEANATFVPQTAPDTLKQSADVLMLTSGIDTITSCLKMARLIFIRIHAVAEYLLVGITTLYLTILLSIVFGTELPLRIQDVLFGGIVFNFLFALSLAFSPDNRKLLLEKLPKYRQKPVISDFYHALSYSVGCSVCIIITYAITKSYEASLSSFTLLLFFYALTNITRTSIFKKKSVKNILLFVSLAVSIAISGLLFFYEPASSLLGYKKITYLKAGISVAISGGYFILLQTFKIWLDKKFEERKRSVIPDAADE